MIPVFTLERQNKLLKKEIMDVVSSVIDSGIFILGPKVKEFEEKFAKYIGVKHAIGVASGTDAISLALLSLDLKAGDEVIIPADSYPSVFALTAIGGAPLLVDVDPDTFTLDPAKVEKAISKKTRAILAVHLYGSAADILSLKHIAKERGIFLVEDCAQAHGTEIFDSSQSPKLPKLLKSLKESDDSWKKVGSLGNLGCFSFYPTKNLGCLGDGGMVVTNNDKLAEKVRLLRMYGEKSRYESIVLGRNSRLDELQAAILLIKLKYLDRWNKRRQEIAAIYRHNLSQVPPSLLSLPASAANIRHIYHLFVIQTPQRDLLKTYLEQKGIQTAIHYPTPIHLEASFAYLGKKQGDFPVSEKISKQALSLPMFPELKNEEIEIVCKEIKDFIDFK